MTQPASGIVKIILGGCLICAGICLHVWRQGQQIPIPTVTPTFTGVVDPVGKTILDKLTPCPEESDLAALHKLSPTLGRIDKQSKYSLDAAEKSIACFRPWAMGISDPCQRNGLAHWLDFFEGEVREGRQKMAEVQANGAKQESDGEKYLRELKEKDRRSRAWEQAHPFPKMPQCTDGGPK